MADKCDCGKCGGGVLDSFTQVNKRYKVQVSSSFLVGRKVTVWRPHPRPASWERLGELTIKAIPVDVLNRPTNELEFNEPMPKGVRVGDLLIYEETETTANGRKLEKIYA